MPEAAKAEDAEHRAEDEEEFRRALREALKRDGFGRLCRGEKDHDSRLSGVRITGGALYTARILRIAAWMSPGFGVLWVWDVALPFYVAVGAAAVALGLWTVPGDYHVLISSSSIRLALNSASVVLTLFATYPIGVALAFAVPELDGLAVIMSLPWMGVLAYGALYAFFVELPRRLRGRVPRFERGAALVFPIGVVALFVQLFTTEVWIAADQLRQGQLLWLTGLTVVPLPIFLHLRLRSSVPDAFATGAKRLVEDTSPEARQELQNQLWKGLAPHKYKPTDAVRSLVVDAFHPPTVAARARAILPDVKRSFDLPLAVALVPMVLGIWIVMSLYVYALAWATVDVTVAGEWLESGGPAVATHTIAGVDVPWGPYPVIAGFLGVVATAVFLALALTEDAYKELLTESAIQRPVQRCLTLGIPYRYLQVKHDLRSAAQPLPDAFRNYADDNTLATSDEHDADRNAIGSGHSLWYRWRAPETEWFSFAAVSSDFEPLVAIYEKGAETAIAISSNGGAARFEADATSDYEIAVDGVAGAATPYGPFTLFWFASPGPGNDKLAAARAIDGLEGTVEGDTTFAATDQADRKQAGLVGDAALWYRWKAPRDGWMVFTADGEHLQTHLVVLTGRPAAGLARVATSHTSEETSQCRVQFQVRADERYYLAVETLGTYRGPVKLAWAISPPPPANDDFDQGTELTGFEGRVEASNAHATREEYEPLHAGRTGARSIWYRWTAPEDRWMQFSTEGSSFDTLLAIYVGAALDQLLVVAANDDVHEGYQSLVRFRARAGEEYHVAVDGYEGHSGHVVLSWSPAPPPPAHASFASALPLTGRVGEERADTSLAYNESGEPRHAGRSGGKSVWYRWTAPEDAWMHFSTEGSTYDTLLAVYIGDVLTDLSLVAENDDAPGARTSLVRFFARAEQEYRIAVDGHAGEGGDLRLTWRPGPPPPMNDDFADARDLTQLASPCTVNTEHATTEPDEPRHADRTGGASIWFRWRPQKTGWVEFSTKDSDFDTLLAIYVGESVGALELIAAHDDVSFEDMTSRVGFRAIAGIEYRIAVDGYHGDTGNVHLSWGRAPFYRVLSYWLANR